MKRKLFLLPITLTTLSPAISLVGCGDPDKPDPEPTQPTSVELDKHELELVFEKEVRSIQLIATVEPVEAEYHLTWTTSDGTVAAVDDNGIVEPVGVGEAIITVLVDGTQLTDSCHVQITEPTQPTSVELDKHELELVFEKEVKSIQLIATVEPVKADYHLTWTTSDGTVAAVDDNGIVEPVGVGEAIITVLVDGTQLTDSCHVQITEPPEPEEYEDVELNNEDGHTYRSDVMTFEEGKNYRFYYNEQENTAWECGFGFYDNVLPHEDRKLNVDVIKVVVDKQVVDYEETSEDEVWYITFPVPSMSSMIEIS